MSEITEEDITKSVSGDENIPLVSIWCTVYNHEPYLRQCLDGFVMQKTNFKFEAIVHDDASTDGSAAIIREYAEKYPDIIKPILETENQYSKKDGSLDRIMDSNMRGKYIAFCEGVDYWIDPNKLQMQVDFLEANPDYGMCYTKTSVYKQNRQKITGVFGRAFNGFEELIQGNVIPTLTVMLRSDFEWKYKAEVKPSEKNWLMGDYPRWLWMSLNTKIKFIKHITSVYRVLENSASHSPDIEKQVVFSKSAYDIQKYFVDTYRPDITLPDFDEHKYRGYFYLFRNQRQKAAEEYMQVAEKTNKIKLLAFICRNCILFRILKLYYSVRGGNI